MYEVEGFDLGDGIKYLPNFVLYDVKGLRDNAVNNDLYVEVMGKMNEEDAEKIKRFHKEGPEYWYYFETVDDDYFGAFPGVDKKRQFYVVE